MDTLRSAAHLLRELGEDLFNALISSDNTGKVREFAKTLLKQTGAPSILPTEMIVGGVTFEILSFLKEGEDSVTGKTMVNRSKEMNASLGEEDCQHIIEHQSDIPVELRDGVAFVFTDWRHLGAPEDVAYVDWRCDRWVRNWGLLDEGWKGLDRVLRRKQPFVLPAPVSPPIKIILGDRVYEALSFGKKGERVVDGNTVLARAKEMRAELGEEDGRYFLSHQDEIPVELRSGISFLFTNWRHPVRSDEIACVSWNGNCWELCSYRFNRDWPSYVRIVHRKQPDTLPTEMTVGGVTYEIVSPLDEGEKSVVLKTIVARAEKMDANLGEDDLLHIMKHQDCIPDKLREAVFVFTGSRKPVAPRLVSVLYWRNGAWEQNWDLGDSPYLDADMPRLLRRKQPAVQPADTLPTEMTIGGVTYEILPILKEGEKSVKGNVLVSRAEQMGANADEKDCKHIVKNQADIPAELRKVFNTFVFPNTRHPDGSSRVACIWWNVDRWVADWHWLDSKWDGNALVPRRIS